MWGGWGYNLFAHTKRTDGHCMPGIDECCYVLGIGHSH